MAKKKKANSKKSDADAPSFEEALEQLEEIVGELEGGELPLDAALGRYEQGVAHLKSCYQQLRRAERKIELLSGVDADGNPISEPFDEDDVESLEAKAAARGRRRSGAGGSRRAAGTADDADAEVDDAGRLF